MAKYRIAWLPGDGVGVEVMEAAKLVLDGVGLDAEYVHGDIGWEFWCREGDAFPARTGLEVIAPNIAAWTFRRRSTVRGGSASPSRHQNSQPMSPWG